MCATSILTMMLSVPQFSLSYSVYAYRISSFCWHSEGLSNISDKKSYSKNNSSRVFLFFENYQVEANVKLGLYYRGIKFRNLEFSSYRRNV